MSYTSFYQLIIKQGNFGRDAARGGNLYEPEPLPREAAPAQFRFIADGSSPLLHVNSQIAADHADFRRFSGRCRAVPAKIVGAQNIAPLQIGNYGGVRVGARVGARVGVRVASGGEVEGLVPDEEVEALASGGLALGMRQGRRRRSIFLPPTRMEKAPGSSSGSPLESTEARSRSGLMVKVNVSVAPAFISRFSK